MDLLLNSQSLYRASGGVHTSALSDGEQLQIVAEDIGRHNTLDKIAGRLLLEGSKDNPRIILQKSWRMGVSVVISRTSPSSLSIRLAERRGITLIGYARRDRFTLYSHPERLFDIAKIDLQTTPEIPKNGKNRQINARSMLHDQSKDEIPSSK